MKKAIVLLLSALAICSCSSSKQFVILHVNDTHSHVEAMRSEPRKGHGGIIERAALVDSIRASRGYENVLLLHAGDFNQGTSYFSTLGGSLEVDVVNAFGYDCITLGNHEFDNGLEDLAARLSRIKCPVVCANLDLTGTPLEPYVIPYTIIEKGGRRIGIIGATSNLARNVAYSISSRITQLDDAESIGKWSEYLHKNEKCDMIILLSHLGHEVDRRVVPALHYIDVVVGGHSHTFLDDFVYATDADGKTVPIIQDGCWGYDIGEIVVD